MQVIFHLGAHRSATTTFQHYMRTQSKALLAQGVGFWGPQRLRNEGLFAGLYAGPSGRACDTAVAAARSRLQRALGVAQARGLRCLVISEENALGSVKGNIRERALYPDALLRLRGFAQALGRPVDKVMLGVRPLDGYWSSALAYGVKRGNTLPRASHLDAIAKNARSWRDVVCDVAEAFETAQIELHDFDSFAARPDARLALAIRANDALPAAKAELRLNAAPELDELRASLAKRGDDISLLPTGEGRWQPFTRAQSAVLAERHADDVFWAVAGAGGIARWIDRKEPGEAGISLPAATRRGLTYDQARRLGQAS